MANSKGLILTSIWMVMIICGWGEQMNDVELPVPFFKYNISRCHGTWYKVEKYNGSLSNLHRCVTIECKTDNNITHEIVSQAAYVSVSQIFIPTRERQFLEGGIVTKPGATDLAIVDLDASGNIIHKVVKVLDTDYDNYAVFTTCKGRARFSCVSDYAVIFTRQRQPSESVLQKARQLILAAGIPLIRKVEIDQTNCPDL